MRTTASRWWSVNEVTYEYAGGVHMRIAEGIQAGDLYRLYSNDPGHKSGLARARWMETGWNFEWVQSDEEPIAQIDYCMEVSYTVSDDPDLYAQMLGTMKEQDAADKAAGRYDWVDDIKEELADERKRDLLFEALCEACGADWTQMTKAERGKYNAACKQLREIGAEPEEVIRRAKRYAYEHKDWALTPTALISHWSEFPKPTRKQELGNEVAVVEAIEEEFVVLDPEKLAQLRATLSQKFEMPTID